MNVLQLNTGLFPDAQTAEAAMGQMVERHDVTAIDLTRRDMNDDDWDAVVQAILAADRIISI